MATIVSQRQADECATSQRIRVRAPLAAQVWQEEEAVLPAASTSPAEAARVAELLAGGQCIAEPAQASRGRQHHGHEVPPSGDRMAEGMHSAVRLVDGLFVAAKITPDVPAKGQPIPGNDAHADGVRRLVAAARDDGRPGAQAGRLGGFRRDRSGHLRTLEGGRQPRWVERKRSEEIRRPVACREVEQQRPGSIGLVHGVLARQPVAGRSPWAAGRGRPGPDIGLVVADPDQLRGGQPGERVVAGDRDQALAPDAAGSGRIRRRSAGRSRGSLAGGPRRPHRAARAPCICPVSPTATTSSPDAPAAARTAPIAAIAPRPTKARGPARSREAWGVRSRTRDADRRAPRPPVDQDGLGRRRRDVDPEDEAHRLSGQRARVGSDPPPRCAGSRCSPAAPGGPTPGGSISPATTRAGERSRAARRRQDRLAELAAQPA